MQAENPWWTAARVANEYFDLPRRAYLTPYLSLLQTTTVKRAVLLMGPRRVGKTVLVHHAIQDLLNSKVEPKRICYLSVDHPLYNGCGLQELLQLYGEAAEVDPESGRSFIFFDEIQYLKDWEAHLKSLVDSYPSVRFTGSGSAAAALRLKSSESGAGRFTDFLLPPVTFHEYISLRGISGLVSTDTQTGWHSARNITQLNEAFVNYLNFGGYPEVIFSKTIQSDPARFIKADIIDKVLLRDLPSLYGIQDIQGLNYLFTTLAYNTSDEVSLEELSKNSGVAKNTIKRYIEYLEAAFLIKVVHRINRNAKRFQRANFFKVYLTNPSMHCALFTPVDQDDAAMSALTETGIFSQWFHSKDPVHYARWDKGEVDIVSLGPEQTVSWAVEVKWSDRYVDRPHELKSVIDFCRVNRLATAHVTTRTVEAERNFDGLRIDFVPASLYCYRLGANIISGEAAHTASSITWRPAP